MTPQGRGQLGGHSSGSACPHPTTKPETPLCPAPWAARAAWVCGSVQGGHGDTRPSPCAYCGVWGAGCLHPQPWRHGSWPPKPSACRAHGEPHTCHLPLRTPRCRAANLPSAGPSPQPYTGRDTGAGPDSPVLPSPGLVLVLAAALSCQQKELTVPLAAPTSPGAALMKCQGCGMQGAAEDM